GVSAVAAAVWWGPYPFSRDDSVATWRASPAVVRDIEAVQAELPADAIVSAYYGYAPHVDHRAPVYMWPNPFVASHWGTFHQEGRRLPEAATVEYLFLPTVLGDHQETLRQIVGDFDVVARSPVAVLYRRKPTGTVGGATATAAPTATTGAASTR